MEAQKIIELYQFLLEHDIPIIIDGGWAVDALVGRQTRPHDDLDIAVSHDHVPKMRKLLSEQGFKDFPRPDSRECNFVLADPQGNKLDVHSYRFDENGNNIYGIEYQAYHFGAIGEILGQQVTCIQPEWLVKFHTGYEVDADDYHDVKMLCEKFNLEMPEEYSRFNS